jgi:hypothetical protein
MRIIVLFNLLPGVSAADYEAWARRRDIPTVRGLASIRRFDVHAATGLLMGDGAPPFAYYETIEVGDADQFGRDVATAEMQRVSAEFRDYADNPVFVLLRDLDAGT